MKMINPFLLFLLLPFILSLGGCTPLPNVSEIIQDAPVTQQSPQILSAKGLLSPKQSKALMERLHRSVDPTDMLQRYVAVIESVSESPLTVVGSSPGDTNRITFVLYVSAITFAENSLHMTNAYFVPDPQTLDALTDAAKRWVDVKIILPGASDSSQIQHGGEYFYPSF